MLEMSVRESIPVALDPVSILWLLDRPWVWGLLSCYLSEVELSPQTPTSFPAEWTPR